jgi:hypothetical protein
MVMQYGRMIQQKYKLELQSLKWQEKKFIISFDE